MPHPYPIREIAQRAGLSVATVDRVLNRRPGVRASTAAAVSQAIVDIDRQRSELRLNGRTFTIDIVMHAPNRFSSAVKSAIERVLPSLRPAEVRPRFEFHEKAAPTDIEKILDGIRHKGSMGVILKAADVPQIGEAIHRLYDAGIPVVTLVTDSPMSRRAAYVGIDNRAAGATAAYLIDQMLGDMPGDVLIALSRSTFRGEEEREIGFRATMRRLAPSRLLIESTDTDGVGTTVQDMTARILEDAHDINAVYSIGGGNWAILEAFKSVGRRCRVFVGHDLDRDNVQLLRGGQISAILDHDLENDMRRACHLIMQAHGAIAGPIESVASQINVVTPFNVPDSAGGSVES